MAKDTNLAEHLEHLSDIDFWRITRNLREYYRLARKGAAEKTGFQSVEYGKLERLGKSANRKKKILGFPKEAFFDHKGNLFNKPLVKEEWSAYQTCDAEINHLKLRFFSIFSG